MARLIRVELGELHLRGGPDPGAAEGVGLAVDRPERAVLPSERLADGLEDLRGRVVYRGRVEEGACRDVLGGESPLWRLAGAGRSLFGGHSAETIRHYRSVTHSPG